MESIEIGRLGFEWWSDNVGSIQVDGTDYLNITLEWRDVFPGDPAEVPTVTDEQREEIFAFAVDVIATAIESAFITIGEEN